MFGHVYVFASASAIEAQMPHAEVYNDGGGLTPKAAGHRQAGFHLSLLGVAVSTLGIDFGLLQKEAKNISTLESLKRKRDTFRLWNP